MASCFEFRSRTHSLDMIQAVQHQRLARFARLFRSRSDPSVKKAAAAAAAAPPGDAKPRRRFVRIVRDAGPAAEASDLDNPHVMHKYSGAYWQSLSLDDGADERPPPPYTVSGHTILKKHGSVDSDGGGCSPKHASFADSVLIVEYDRCGEIESGARATHKERLNDTDDESSDADDGSLTPTAAVCQPLSPVCELPPTTFGSVAETDCRCRHEAETDGAAAVKFERSLSTDSESEEQPVKKSARFAAQSILDKVVDIRLDADTRHQMAPEV